MLKNICVYLGLCYSFGVQAFLDPGSFGDCVTRSIIHQLHAGIFGLTVLLLFESDIDQWYCVTPCGYLLSQLIKSEAQVGYFLPLQNTYVGL